MSTQQKERTHYDVLGIEPNADRPAVRRAYIKAVRKHHPDVGGDADEFIAISTAYEVLYDDEARRSYDREIGSESVADDEPAPEAPTGPQTDAPTPPRATRKSGGIRPPTIPNRRHIFEEMDGVPDSPWRRRIMILAGLGLGGLGVWMAWAFPGNAEVQDFADKVLTTFVLTYVALIVLGLTWALSVFSAMTRAFAGAASLTYVGLAGLVGFTAASMRDDVPWQYWTGVCLVVAATVVSAIAYFTPSKSGSARGSNADVNFDLLDYPIFGKPGESVESSGLDAERVAVGAEGERKTARHLEKLLGFEGLRIFHSMRFNPLEKTAGDIDHVLVYGRNIILVDSKVWTPGEYAFSTDEDGDIVDDETIIQKQENGRIRTRGVKVARAVELYQRAFPSYRVVAWLIVHPSQGRVILDNTGATSMRMATMQDGLDEIATHLSNVTGGTVYSSLHDLTTINRLHAV